MTGFSQACICPHARAPPEKIATCSTTNTLHLHNAAPPMHHTSLVLGAGTPWSLQWHPYLRSSVKGGRQPALQAAWARVARGLNGHCSQDPLLQSEKLYRLHMCGTGSQSAQALNLGQNKKVGALLWAPFRALLSDRIPILAMGMRLGSLLSAGFAATYSQSRSTAHGAC